MEEEVQHPVETNAAVTEATHGKEILGPVDYLMVRFPGNKFSGEIVPELANLEAKGIIRVIDLVFVLKDPKGSVLITEAKDLQGSAGKAYAELAKNTREWFSEGDIKAIAESLPNNSSAGLLLFENVWAIKFKKALINADAELIDMGRIPPETIEKAQLAMEGGS